MDIINCVHRNQLHSQAMEFNCEVSMGKNVIIAIIALVCTGAFAQNYPTPNIIAPIRVKEPARHPQWILGKDTLSIIWCTLGSYSTYTNMSDYYIRSKDNRWLPNPNRLEPPYWAITEKCNYKMNLELRYLTIIKNDALESLPKRPKSITIENYCIDRYPEFHIVTTANNGLLISEYDRSTELHSEIGIVIRRLSFGINPSLTIRDANDLIIHYPPRGIDGKRLPGILSDKVCARCILFIKDNQYILLALSDKVYLITSTDEGITWQEPKEICDPNGIQHDDQHAHFEINHAVIAGKEVMMVGLGPYSGDDDDEYNIKGYLGWDDDMPTDIKPIRPLPGSLLFWHFPIIVTKSPSSTKLINDEDVTDCDIASDGEQHLYVVYTRSSSLNNGSIWLITSLDGGVTWNTPTRLTDGKALDRDACVTIYNKALWIAYIHSEYRKPGTVFYIRCPLRDDGTIDFGTDQKNKPSPTIEHHVEGENAQHP